MLVSPLAGPPIPKREAPLHIQFKAKETCVSLVALGQAAEFDRVMGPGLGGGGGLRGGMWPNGHAAGPQTPGLWVQVPGCAQGFLAVLVIKSSSNYRRPCGGLRGGMWPSGHAAGLQTPGVWVQVPGCAQGYSVVLVIKSSSHYRRPCGLMDKALVLGTKDCRFESCQDQ